MFAKMDERRSQIIELRFFGGLTVEETAVVLKVAPDTVMRDARFAIGQGVVGPRARRWKTT